ncbi:MAG: hypothetical protein JWQ67_460 [Marmoricola sp.]|nr:hypothetical protein [Marmoricola sp.]
MWRQSMRSAGERGAGGLARLSVVRSAPARTGPSLALCQDRPRHRGFSLGKSPRKSPLKSPGPGPLAYGKNPADLRFTAQRRSRCGGSWDDLRPILERVSVPAGIARKATWSQTPPEVLTGPSDPRRLHPGHGAPWSCRIGPADVAFPLCFSSRPTARPGSVAPGTARARGWCPRRSWSPPASSPTNSQPPRHCDGTEMRVAAA